MAQIILSPSQAILILIKKNRHNPKRYPKLRKLYLFGIKNEKDKKFFFKCLKDPSLKNIVVNIDPKAIDNCPSRRYFETHFSYSIVNKILKNIDDQKFNQYYKKFYNLLPPDWQSIFDNIFKDITTPFHDPENITFTRRVNVILDTLIRIQNKSYYPDLDDTQREKIIAITKLSIFSIVIVTLNDTIPLDIFNSGIFLKQNRGLILKDEVQSLSHNGGILKSFMPMGMSDLLFASRCYTYPRCSEKATYDPSSEWAKQAFARIVHPFCNSISGTLLAFLRIHLELIQYRQASFDKLDEFKDLAIIFMCSLLYMEGGHSLFEYTALFDLHDVKNELLEKSRIEELILSMLLTHLQNLDLSNENKNESLEMIKNFIEKKISSLSDLNLDPNFNTKKSTAIYNINEIKKTFLQYNVKKNELLNHFFNELDMLLENTNQSLHINMKYLNQTLEQLLERLQNAEENSHGQSKLFSIFRKKPPLHEVINEARNKIKYFNKTKTFIILSAYISLLEI